MVTHIPYYQVLEKMERFIRKHDPLFFNWEIGITDHPEKSLFELYGVDRESDIWFFQDVPTSHEAEKILRYFLNLGCIEINHRSGHACCIFAFRRKD